VSVSAKLQKQPPTDLKSNSSHLPSIPRLQPLSAPENASSSISKQEWHPQNLPATPLSHDSVSAPIMSESCGSSTMPSFPSFSNCSTTSPINSCLPPELISIDTDPSYDGTPSLDSSFLQPASCTSASSSYYSSYSPSRGRTVRVGHGSLLHRSKSLFSLKRYAI
jgi:hypothetical protein